MSNTKKHLIMIAHGSRRETSNEHFIQLTQSLSQSLPSQYGQVHACFLEMVQPDLIASIDKAVTEGANAIDIFPYFLGPGNHVLEDIPALIETAQVAHSHCEFKQLDYFGSSANITDLISSAIASQQ